MNSCEEMNGKIWAGERSVELDEHLRSCPDCRAEMEEKERLITRLASLEVPLPSRSLKPGTDVIRATVHRNRRKSWRRYATVAAAAAVVLISTVTGITLRQNVAQPPVDAVNPPAQHVADPTTAQNHETTPSTTPQQNPEPMSGQGLVEVGNITADRDVVDALAAYLNRVVSPKEVKKIRIDAFKSAGAITSNTQRVGDLTLNVQLQPGRASVFTEGRQTVLARVTRPTREVGWNTQYVETLGVSVDTPVSAAQVWLQALKARDGVVQYGISAPAWRNANRSALEKSGWSLADSEPRITDYTLLPSDGKWNGLPFVRARLTQDDGQLLDVDIALKQYGSVWRVEQYEYSKPAIPADPAPGAKNSITLDTIKQTLFLGQPRAVVEKNLGADYVIEKQPVDGKLVLRYVFSSKPDYTSPQKSGTSSSGTLTTDEVGLKNGDVRLELHVGLTDKGTVKDFEVFYHVDPDKYGTYSVTTDGKIQDNGVQK